MATDSLTAMASEPRGPAAGAEDGHDWPPLLFEEWSCAVLLALMVLLMFTQAMSRNLPSLARTELGAWLAHASEVLPSGLTWLTFLACGAVTRRRELLRVDVVAQRLTVSARNRLEAVTWWLWGSFFAVVFVLGIWSTYSQRHQTTSLAWLPQWAVALSIPVGSALVLWRTVQNLRDMRRAERARGIVDGAEVPSGGAS